MVSRGTLVTDQLWIGLYDRDHIDEETDPYTCAFASPSGCERCRNRFVWVDETPVNEEFTPWTPSEPGYGEKCIRLTDSETNQRWSGSPCSNEIDYVCSKGKTRTQFTFFFNRTL